MNTADWTQPGAHVAEHMYSATGGTHTPTTVARRTKTQIVLANGRRYSRATLRPVGDTSWNYKLVPWTPHQDAEEA